MTFRINRHAAGDKVVLRLIGNMHVEEIEEVKTAANVCSQVVLDIGELTLVGAEGIRFLNACEDVGMGIINASPYISEWMLLERDRGSDHG
jgi:predicted ATP-grasp superfamily ATP-dependent carboligase